METEGQKDENWVDMQSPNLEGPYMSYIREVTFILRALGDTEVFYFCGFFFSIDDMIRLVL